MIKLSSGSRNENLELPVKITYEGKEFWIKKATKTNGLYLNDIPPKIEMKVKESDSVTITKYENS